MKKLFIVLFVIIGLNTWATDYVIVRNGNQSTIYDITTGSSGTVYLSVFPLTNPSVDMLKQIGLPGYLWSQLNASDGIFDTRLEECKSQLNAANAQLSNDTTYIDELESTRGLYRFACVLLTIIIIILSLVIITNKPRR